MAQRNDNADTTIWRAPDLGAELLHGRFRDFSYDVHTHDTACFALLTWGGVRIRMRGAEHIARRGDLYAIAADQPHAGTPLDEQGWKLRTLYVELDHLRMLAGDERPTRGVSLNGPIIRDAALTAALYGVHRCSQRQGSPLLREQRYLAFAGRLFARHVRDGAPPVAVGKEERAVRLAREFLDHHLAQQRPLADIAAAAGLPLFRLFRAFSAEMGMTPHAYQRQARIRLAGGLIRLGKPLGEVAATAGFADQAHLTRSFRRAMGITPGDYRKGLR